MSSGLPIDTAVVSSLSVHWTGAGGSFTMSWTGDGAGVSDGRWCMPGVPGISIDTLLFRS